MKKDSNSNNYPAYASSLVVFLVLSISSFGQMPYFRKLATIDDIGHGQIKCIYQDKQGFVWLGATSGAYRYDGQDFFELQLPDSILNKSVTAIFEDSSHLLWFGFEDGNILKYDRFQVMDFKTESQLPATKITSVTEGKNHSLWFGTYGEGIFVYQDYNIIHFNSESGLSDDYIYTLLPDEKGNIWAGTDNGISICSLENGKPSIRVLSVPEGLPDFIVKSIKKDKEGKIWIGMHSKGLACFDPAQNRFENSILQNNWNYGAINDMIVLNESLWIATDGNGLVEFFVGKDEFTPINSSAGLNLSRINSMLNGTEGNIWLVTNKDIYFSLGNRIETLETLGGISVANIHAILVDSDDILWFANNGGLYSYDIHHNAEKSSLKQYPLSHLTGESKIMSLYSDPYGMIWLGTFGKGIIRFDPKSGREKLMTRKDGLPNENVLSIKGTENEIWMATLGGAIRCKMDKQFANINFVPEFTNYGRNEGLSNNYIYNLHIDHSGQLWFATDGSGVCRYKDGEFYNIHDNTAFTDKIVYSVTTDAEGNVWMNVAKEGLYKYDGKEVIKVFNDENHKNKSFSGIICNTNNELIIAYDEGIDVLNTITGEVAHYEGNAGLFDINPDPNTLTIDSGGDVWIGSDKGIIRYRSSSDQLVRSPQPRIKQVSVYLEKINHFTDTIFGYKQNHFSFEYSGLWYQYPDKVEYLTQLEGHDLDWIRTKNNNVIYSNLLPGKYTFKVKAGIYGNFEVVPIDTYSFTIRPPFWTQAWFLLIMFLLIAIIAYLYIKLREARLKRNQEALREKIRFQFENLKSQINPHFLFNSFSTLIALIDQDQETAIEYVEELSNLFRSLLEYQDQDLIPLREELSIIDNYFKLQKKRYGDNLVLAISTDVSGEEILLPPLTLQLLIENAIKHNVVSKDHPLQIKIYIDTADGFLFVENNLMEKKEPVDSTGIGIRNIIDRYHLLTEKKIQIIKSAASFKVGLPIIIAKNESTHH